MKLGNEARPIVNIELSPLEKLLSAICWAGSFLSLFWMIRFYSSWPEIVPIHFNASGKADGYGPKATLFILPVVMIGLTTLLQWLSRKPYLYNYPIEITPENAIREYSLASKMIRILNAIIITCLTTVIVTTHGSEGVDPHGPGLWFLPVLLVGVFGTIIGYLIVRSRKQD